MIGSGFLVNNYNRVWKFKVKEGLTVLYIYFFSRQWPEKNSNSCHPVLWLLDAVRHFCLYLCWVCCLNIQGRRMTNLLTNLKLCELRQIYDCVESAFTYYKGRPQSLWKGYYTLRAESKSLPFSPQIFSTTVVSKIEIMSPLSYHWTYSSLSWSRAQFGKTQKDE